MMLKRGDLFHPKHPDTWIGDPSDIASPALYDDRSWPAVVLDDQIQFGTSSIGTYVYKRILLASGRVIEVYPSLLDYRDPIY